MLKKKKGSKFWAHSYVQLKDGTKIYLEESLSDLEENINSKKETIRVRIAGKFEDIVIKKENIDYYGSVSSI